MRVLIIFLLLTVTPLCAQIDTEFWFAPPEVSSGHGDRPILLQLSAMQESATVTIRLPAASTTPLATLVIGSGQSRRVDITPWIGSIETTPAALVRNSGLHITSTAPITAYYEVSSTWNVDIFTLKGKNAIGNQFIIPGQNIYDISNEYNPVPTSTVDIVATRNNTVVMITPASDVRGHDAGEEFRVKLNRGQTYSIRRNSSFASNHLGGTVINANKPIAVTLKDDSAIEGGCRDLLGDQHIPVKVAGREYVVIKGFLDAGEYAFITGIEDSTEVVIGGSTTEIMGRGDLFRIRLEDAATHILADKPVYVLHVTGFGCEAGMAVLPSVNCRGSDQIGFTRSTTEFFGLNILVRREGISNFTLNGRDDLITGDMFDPVEGTDDAWYAAQVPFEANNIVSANMASLISNTTHSFQIGLVNGGAGTSCRYGYFSAFSTLFIGDDQAICPGDSLLLDAGIGKDDYVWSDGSGESSLYVKEPGKYWVTSSNQGCTLSDTVEITVREASLNLGDDASFCPGDTFVIDGGDQFSWQWSNGHTGRYLEVTEPGIYSLSITNFTGCSAADSIIVTQSEKPEIDLGQDTVKCPEETIELQAFWPGATYAWNTGSTDPSITADTAGTYIVEVQLNTCSVSDTIIISGHPTPAQEQVYGSPSVCPQVEAVDYYVDETENTTYEWQASGGVIVWEQQDSIRIDWGDANDNACVSVQLTNEFGCSSRLNFPVIINQRLQVALPSGPDSLCINLGDEIVYAVGYTNGSVYEWQIPGAEVLSAENQSEIEVKWTEPGSHAVFVTETSITDTDVCDGTSDTLIVNIIEDTTSLDLLYTSVNDKGVEVHWEVNQPERILGQSLLLHREADNAGEDTIFTLHAWDTIFLDTTAIADQFRYSYYIAGQNSCLEAIETNSHAPVKLVSITDTISGLISLEWDHYEGWGGFEDVTLVQITDDIPESAVIAYSSDPSVTIDGNNGFLHEFALQYRHAKGWISSSNIVTVELQHPVTIPNLITPNADGHNDYLVIPKVELYPDARLRIMNRWGQVVYQTVGYDNSWEGEGDKSGIYFYQLELPRNEQLLKGFVEVMQ